MYYLSYSERNDVEKESNSKDKERYYSGQYVNWTELAQENDTHEVPCVFFTWVLFILLLRLVAHSRLIYYYILSGKMQFLVTNKQLRTNHSCKSSCGFYLV